MIKVVVLLFVCIVGYTAGSASNLTPFLNPAWEEDGIFLGSSILFFSYVGFDALGTAAEEVSAACWGWGRTAGSAVMQCWRGCGTPRAWAGRLQLRRVSDGCARL